MPYNPKTLSQRDPAWKNEKLGFDAQITIGTDGCALTCLAMLVNGFGFDETPSTLNRKLKDMGPGAGFMGPLIVWSGLTRLFPKIVYKDILLCRDHPAPRAAIDAALAAGRPPVIEIDRSPNPDLQNHWVVLTGRKGDDYLMLDPFALPADPGPVSLSARYAFGRPLDEIITAVVWYEATDSTPLPPGEGVTVRVESDVTAGLRLRDRPSVNGLTLATEPSGALLLSLEGQAATAAKVGVQDQWLNVRDPQGLHGYVAAWLVESTDGAASGTGGASASSPAGGAEPSGLTVAVGAQASAGLRLRSQPEASAATLAVLMPGTVLSVLEPAVAAGAKIGVQGQWLNVREPGGKSGYVAAWYLEARPGAADAPAAGGAPRLTVLVSGQASAGLRLRTQPDSGAPTLKVLSAGTPLTVLEDPASAGAKVGVQGQWLNVRETGGQAGYVAAWYVE